MQIYELLLRPYTIIFLAFFAVKIIQSRYSMSVCPHCHKHLELALKGKEKVHPKYSYDDLPTSQNSIRILVLFSSPSYDSEIECELRNIEFVSDRPLEYSYEALSWNWGVLEHTGRIIVRKGDKKKRSFQKNISPDLEAALRALRYLNRDRYLWIDQVCINQDYTQEKNHQVVMMADIYGRASKVCIWLGEADSSSRIALKFIKEEVLQLQNFDELCESEKASQKWAALLDLMQRPWFSRRWVVQEVALARRTVVYCGSDKISWKKFAIAVELFVEVETATHRLSEVMKKDARFDHVPGWFEYVSALGASLLVLATSKLFRDYKPYGPDGAEKDSDSESESDTAEMDREDDDTSPISDKASPLNPEKNFSRALGQPLLTLEYLVSSLSIFEVTKSHDAIYALLAIARDTVPFAGVQGDSAQQLIHKAFAAVSQRKSYTVDYEQPFEDVGKNFIEFCMTNSNDHTRALDIICRP